MKTKRLIVHSASYKYPIFTLPTIGVRTYVVTTPDLASVVQRQSKSYSFYSFVVDITQRILGLDEETMRIVRRNADGFEGHHGLMPELHTATTKSLRPGPELDAVSKIQMDAFTGILGDTMATEECTTGLLSWLSNAFALSNARAIYGPQNIFAAHPELIPDFWYYESRMISLASSPVPWFTDRKAYLARERLYAAMLEYYQQDHHHNASMFVQTRADISIKHGMTKAMMARSELIILFGILANATPTTFWLLANIYSRPELLAELRREVMNVTTANGDTRCIQVHKVMESCPLLVSTYRETMRHIANLASVRLVREDTWVADKYLLKKGSIIQVAGGVIHLDENIWGADAHEFKPDRFLDDATESDKTSSSTKQALPRPRNVPSAAFRSFGGGSVICPGRHYAQNEIVGFAAAMILAFDITNPDGTTIALPEKDDLQIPLSVMKPVVDPLVSIRPRMGMEHIRWIMTL